MSRCVCGCSGKVVHRHHVVTAAVIRREGGDVADDRNLVPIAGGCHGAHHSRMRPLWLYMLPDSVFDFARELLGPGPAYELLRRNYSGGDPRLDALLEDEAA